MSDPSARVIEGMSILEAPPSVGWVVHEVVHERDAEPTVWAWCKVEVDQPGYAEITFTKTDGRTPADDPTTKFSGPIQPALRLGAVLFKLWC